MSEIKVNKISPRTACGTTTLGDSGDTFTIPAGVSITNSGTASGFGATGAVSWNTTVKTGDFTAVDGEGYFVNTTSGAITVTLPSSPSAGAVVGVKDYANTFDTNSCTLNRNGSNIGGLAVDSTISTEGLAVTLVYVDATKGWLVTDSGLQSEAPGPQYICASVSGSCNAIATSGDFKIATFKGPGTFTVNSVGNAAGGGNTVDYLVVAGGGGTPGNGYNNTPNGGAGAGGLRASATTYAIGCNPAKPLVCGVSALAVSAQGYTIAVGGGGAGGSPGPGNAGANGGTSSFSTITSAGGGVGAMSPGGDPAGNGGSGGGGMGSSKGAGSGNTPPVSPPQGKDGGVGVSFPTNPSPGSDNSGTGGGGGAIQPGFNGGTGTPLGGGGDGGDGAGFTDGAFGASNGECSSSIQYFAGGGGGGVYTPSPGPNSLGVGGLGGGGNGGSPASHPTQGARQGQAGTTNTGGGGGANGGAPSPSDNFAGNAGGSGIVVIRYKFQN